MAESSKTHHFIPVIIFPSKVSIYKGLIIVVILSLLSNNIYPRKGLQLDAQRIFTRCWYYGENNTETTLLKEEN